MKHAVSLILGTGVACFILGFFLAQSSIHSFHSEVMVSADTAGIPAPPVTSNLSVPPLLDLSSSDTFSSNDLSLTSTEVQHTRSYPQNPETVSPLEPQTQSVSPSHGPQQSIAQVGPFIADKTTAEVDEAVTFTATVQNQSSKARRLYYLCFESTDGNFGCVSGVNLDPGQTYTITAVGTWVSGGHKKIWLTWSPDPVNYYRPKHSSTVGLTILG